MNHQDLINKTLAEAVQIAENNGYTIRVMKDDGENMVGTCDIRSNRISVETRNGIVVGIIGVG